MMSGSCGATRWGGNWQRRVGRVSVLFFIVLSGGLTRAFFAHVLARYYRDGERLDLQDRPQNQN
jgi:hypothetical protein